ncbi:MAG: glutamate synthase-related protein, partial [bacterium]
IMGAEQYNFGKLLLVAQGCVMARICEKNTCPTGIATHNPKFKAKYKGHKDHIVKLMHYLAEDVRRHLAKAGVDSLQEIIGRTDLLEIHPDHEALANCKNLDLSFILSRQMVAHHRAANPFREDLGSLNQRLMEDTQVALDEDRDVALAYEIKSTDRAVLARLAGEIAQREHHAHLAKFSQNGVAQKIPKPYNGTIKLTFTGSGGQGFGVFMPDHLNVKLFGEANDSVCKSMSGGKMVICPPPQTRFNAEENVIIGNCALYGATGGKLYVNGLAGDRFAVRNSGALAIVEGVGLHACEYMTNGAVIILGKASYNLGSGITGGKVYLYQEKAVEHVNTEFLIRVEVDAQELGWLAEALTDYFQETKSRTARSILRGWNKHKKRFKKFIPLEALATHETTAAALVSRLKHKSSFKAKAFEHG